MIKNHKIYAFRFTVRNTFIVPNTHVKLYESVEIDGKKIFDLEQG